LRAGDISSGETPQKRFGGMTVGHENLWSYQNVLPLSVRSLVSSAKFGTVLGFVAFLVAYYFAYRYGMAFSQVSASPFWFPDSVLLCALLKSRRELWWVFLLSTLPIRVFSDVAADIPLWFLLTAASIDGTRILVSALLLQRFMRNPLRFETVRDFAVFVLFAVVLVPAIFAFGGAAARAVQGADFWLSWVQWFMGDAVTQLVVTPAILYWVFGAPQLLRTLEFKRLAEAAALTAGLVAAAYWAFAGGGSVSIAETRFFVPIIFLFWAALRFGMYGASGAVAILSYFVIASALEGSGPFVGLSPSETAFALQNFVLLRAGPLHLVATLIEQRQGVERSLQESEERFRTMANSAPVLLWMSGPDKLCTFFNQGWLKFTGRTLEQELGNGWTEGVHPDDLRHYLETYETAFAARQPFEIEYRLRRHDGEYRWILDAGAPRIALSGEFLGYIGSALDITDRKGTEESNRALAHVQRLAIIGELTAAIAHELKQPLSAIMSNADAARTLLDTPEPPLDEIRDIVSDIRRADLRADEVLGQVRDFLRKREIRMQPLDINGAVSDVLPLVLGDARKRRVNISTDLAGDLPLVFGNQTQLQQVLINLVVNGMDAMVNTPEGKRHLLIRTSKPNGDARVEVAVSDSGAGVPAGSLPQLFESFFTTRAEGMGLGLSIARSIVESHGGRIWADNNPNGGATFHFTVQTASARLSGSPAA
jgi:PAS domain S-box-containing protein